MDARVVGPIVKGRVYVVTMTPPCAKDLLFVSSYDTQDPMSNALNKHGYQRPPTASRFSQIAGYFLDNSNAELITPLLVSVRLEKKEDIEKFLSLLAAGDIAAIKANFGAKVASVVDGQHRLGGLVKAWMDDNEFLPDIPIILYFGLSVWFFLYMFRRSRETGQFARNEE